MSKHQQESTEANENQGEESPYTVKRFLGSVAISTIAIGVLSEVMNLAESALDHHSLGVGNVAVATTLVAGSRFLYGRSNS